MPFYKSDADREALDVTVGILRGTLITDDHFEKLRELRAPRVGEVSRGTIVRLKISKRGFAYAGETATVEEVDRDRDTFIVAFDRVRTLRLFGSDEGSAWERF